MYLKFFPIFSVSRKFGYNCVYVFHVIVPSSQVWQKIISQTNIFNIFPASVPFNTVSKIIQSNCILQSKKHVPARSLWINWVFSDLANSHEKHCLTIDCGYLNKNGPGRYRSSANNPDKQVCYFNKPGDYVFYNTLISERIKEGEYSEGIYFKIEKVRGNNDKENFDAKRILEDGTGNVRSDGIYAASKPEQDRAGAETIRPGNKRFGDSWKPLQKKTKISKTKIPLRIITSFQKK